LGSIGSAVRHLTSASSLNATAQCNKRKADKLSNASTSKRSKTRDLDPKRRLDAIVQTGLYTAEMFAANIAAKYVINLVVVVFDSSLYIGCALTISFLDVMIWIWYYDWQGTVQSSGINFTEDLPRFMALLYALQRFHLEDWGRNVAFKPDESSHKS
jgi:hypothetical protein